jgi:acetyltransferase
MFDIAECFARLPLPAGRKVAIVSEGGGDNSVAADNAELKGLEVPVLPESTQDKIRPFLLQGMPAGNPIDYGGTAEENPDMINKTIEVLMQDEQVDAVYVTGFFGGFKEIIAPHVGALEEKTSGELGRLMRAYGKPIVVHTSFANEPFPAIRILRENGIFVTASSERAARCLSALADFSRDREEIRSAAAVRRPPASRKRAAEILRRVNGEERSNLTEPEARALLAEYGIPLQAAVLADSEDAAVAAAAEIGGRIALKIVSSKIVHTSDVGGVRLNLSGEAEIREGFRQVMRNAQAAAPSSEIDGVLVAPMAASGRECIVGMARDPQFGPAVMFGLGGIFVEVLKDVSFRVLPLFDRDLDGMIREIKGYPVLGGIRGEKPKDVAALKEIIARIGQIALDFPEIAEIDLNPVIVHEKGASIVDARIILG